MQPKPNQTQYEKFRPKPNQTATFRHNPNPNRTKPKTKHLNISKYKIFSNWRKIILLLFLNIKFWEILIFVSLKVFYIELSYFLRNLKKNFRKMSQNFWKIVFWFCRNKAEPNWKIVAKTRTKPQPNSFRNSEPNPTQTRPKSNQTQKNWNQSQL